MLVSPSNHIGRMSAIAKDAFSTAPLSLTPLVEPSALVADLRRQGFALLPVRRHGPWLAPFYAVLDDDDSSVRSNKLNCLAPSALHSVSLKEQPGVKRRAQLRRRGRIKTDSPLEYHESTFPRSVGEANHTSTNDATSSLHTDPCTRSEAEASFQALEALAHRCFAAVCEDVGLPLAHVIARLFPPGSKHKAVFNAMLYVDGGRRGSSCVEEWSELVSGVKPTTHRGETVDSKEAITLPSGRELEGTFQIHSALDSDLVSEPWCRSHGDPGLLTLLTRSDLAALQLQAHNNDDGGGDGTERKSAEWLDIEPLMDTLAVETRARLANDCDSMNGNPCDSTGSDGASVEVLLLISGYSLERLTDGAYKACVHRVPRCDLAGARRHTAAFELRPALDIWQAWHDEVEAEKPTQVVEETVPC